MREIPHAVYLMNGAEDRNHPERELRRYSAMEWFDDMEDDSCNMQWLAGCLPPEGQSQFEVQTTLQPSGEAAFVYQQTVIVITDQF